MTDFLILLLAVAFVVTALVSGFIVRNFKAKRPQIALTVILVALAVAAAVWGYTYFPDSLVVFIIFMLALFALLILVSGLGILESLVITIAGISTAGVVLMAGGIALDKYQGQHSINEMATFVQKTDFLEIRPIKSKKDQLAAMDDMEEDEESMGYFSESELLPEGSKKKIIKLKSKAYIKVSPSHADQFRGMTARLLKKDGTLLKGTIIKGNSSQIVLSMYLMKEKGLIKAPVALSSIQQLEVYR